MVKQNDITYQPETDFEEVLDGFTQNSGMVTMQELEDMVNQILSTLPRINRNALLLEMEEMRVDLHQNPTTQDLNEGLAKSQAYKDRLAEIYMLALREYRTRNRCVDMLFDAFNIISKGSSADKRKGEATMKYPLLLIQLEASETFLKTVEHVLQNIKSAHESVSRQITIAQLQLQLGEIRRENKAFTPKESEEISGVNKSGSLDWNDM